MRTSVLCLFVALAFTAALAAPHHSHHVAINAKQVQPTINAIQPKNLIGDLVDIVSELIKVDIRAVVAQIPVTQAGIEAAVQKAVAEASVLVGEESAAAVAQLEAVAKDAAVRAQEILQPLLDVLEKILGGNRHLSKDIVEDLIEAFLGMKLEDFLQLVKDTVSQLEALAQEVANKVQGIANSISAEVGQKAEAILKRAAAEIKAALQPLLDLLVNVLPPTDSRVAKQTRDLISDVIALIKALLGIDIKAILEQIPLTVQGVEAALQKAVDALVQLLESTDAEIEQRLVAIVNAAVAEAQLILQPVVDLFAPLIPDSRRAISISPKDLLDDILQLILGKNLAEIVEIIETAESELVQLVQETIAKIQSEAQAVSAELVAEVNVILDRAVRDIQAAVEPLAALLAPLLRPPTKAVAAVDPIQVIIDLISKLTGVDVRELLVQLEISAAEIQRILSAAAEALSLVVAEGDAALSEALSTILANAFAQAQEIITPLLEILAPIFGGGEAQLKKFQSKNLIEDLINAAIEKLLGISAKDLIELVASTATRLETLAAETVAKIQDVSASIGADTDAKVQAILVQAQQEIEAALQPVYEILKPILEGGSSNNAVVHQKRDLIDDLLALLIQALETALGIDISAIAEQAKVSYAEVLAAYQKADAKLAEILAGSDLEARLAEIQNRAVAQVRAIVEELVASLPGSTIAEIVANVEVAFVGVQGILEQAIVEVRQLVAGEAAALLPEVREVLRQLTLSVNAAVQPLLDLLKPLFPPSRKTLRLH